MFVDGLTELGVDWLQLDLTPQEWSLPPSGVKEMEIQGGQNR